MVNAILPASLALRRLSEVRFRPRLIIIIPIKRILHQCMLP